MAFGTEGLRGRLKLHGSSEKGDFGHFLILSYVLMQKRLTIKAFVEVTLVLLTLSARTVVKNF